MAKAKDNTDMEAELKRLKVQFEDFLTDTETARDLSERDRDYYDGKQWKEEEIAVLRARGQASIVSNRVKPKVEGLKGLVSIRRTDPKAFPRSMNDKRAEQTAHAITDALRYVMDNNNFTDAIEMPVAEDYFIEGYGGCIVGVRQDPRGEFEIVPQYIPWDRIYYDPYSRLKDFSDAKYMGVCVWLDFEDITEQWGVDEDDLNHSDGDIDSTFEDRPRWIDRTRKRARVCQHFFLKKGVWHMAYYTGNIFLQEPEESPYLDEYDQPTNPIELVSAYVDRDNKRYGEVRDMIDLQDEINKRRSKGLFMMSARQILERQGALKDVETAKEELKKPDGVVQYEGEKGDAEIIPNGDMGNAQFSLYQDAKAEMDAKGFNAQLAGERQQGDLSGRAIDKLQTGGMLELNSSLGGLTGWKKRVYRQIWARIRQFWDETRWIRVTDDYDNLRWVGLNNEITTQQWLEETIEDESLPPRTRKEAAASYMFLTNAAKGAPPELMEAANQGNPQAIEAVIRAQQLQQQAQAALEEFIAVENKVSELDVDIILEQSFDTINAKQELLDAIIKLGASSGVDIIDVIELMNLQGKDLLIEKIEKRRAAQAEAQGAAGQLRAQESQAKTAKTMAETQVKTEEAMQKRIENELMVRNPDQNPQAIV